MIYRFLRLFFQLAFAAALLCTVQSAHAQGRLALVLESEPDEDSAPLRTALRGAGYSVIDPGVANRDGIAWSVDVFARKLGRSGPDTVGIVYARLPGASSDGESYLLPSKAVLEEDGNIAADGYAIRDLLSALSGLNSSNIGLVLDLCKNEGEDGVETKFTAPIPESPNVLIADCRSRDAAQEATMSSEFVQAITSPGLTLRQVFERTDRGGPGPAIAQGTFSPSQPQANQNDATAADTSLEGIVWNAIRASTDETVIAEYLDRFPDSDYADDAQARLNELKAAPGRAAATPSAQEPAKPSTTPTLGQQLAAIQAKKPRPRDASTSGTSAANSNRYTAVLAGTDATGWGNLYRHDCGATVGYRMTLQLVSETWHAQLVRMSDGMTMQFVQHDRLRDDGIAVLHAHSEGAKVTLKVKPGSSHKATYAIPTAGIGSCAVGYLY
ncbi:hypothetical protein EOI86_07745 [Hwanghaeella grinnelliae]|uniref:Caspase family protein n=1 Tax=Hwanghaeella grinnelliae TaxID=2500179 RepID=A0A437QX96_9PROT|nr:hypothetical protein [Hwanghaeella grinnelliae]RVU39132.1 hypothetical protein EOI86_07745 [Hwanghaeella grinnelliae]